MSYVLAREGNAKLLAEVGAFASATRRIGRVPRTFQRDPVDLRAVCVMAGSRPSAPRSALMSGCVLNAPKVGRLAEQQADPILVSKSRGAVAVALSLEERMSA